MAMTLRPSDEDDMKITKLAEIMQVSKHEAVLRAVRKAHDDNVHADAVARAAKRARTRYAKLNEKLKHE